MKQISRLTSAAFTALSIGACTGVCIGCILAARTAAQHRYFDYGMYRLILLRLQEASTFWVLAAALVCIGLYGMYCAAVCIVKKKAARSMAFTAICSPQALVEGTARYIRAAGLCVLCFVFLINIVMYADSALNRPAGPNIVMIVIDCLRADHLGCNGYGRDTSPAINALSGAGLFFQQAYANAPWTKPSVASLFTSLHPRLHGVVDSGSTLPDRALTLAEILRNAGYRTWFFNGGNVFLKPPFKFDQGFEKHVYRPHRTHTGAHVTTDFVAGAFAAGKSRFFAYLHFMDAHTPYTKNPHNSRFVERHDPRFIPGNRKSLFNKVRGMLNNGTLSEAAMQHIVSLYDGQIRFVDDQIKTILFALQQNNMLDDTVFIITSDHGDEFGDHGSFEHGHTLYNELLHIPLIIAGPGIAKRSVRTPVRLLDLAPTVLSICGIPAPPAVFEGVDLTVVADDASGGHLPVYASGVLYGSEKYCLIKNDVKIVFTTNDTSGKWKLVGPARKEGVEVYDLAVDPDEREAVGGNNQAVDMLTAALEAHKNTPPLFSEKADVVVIDADMQDKLEALGYVR